MENKSYIDREKQTSDGRGTNKKILFGSEREEYRLFCSYT